MFTSGNPGRWRIIRKGHKPKASMTNFLHILHIPEQMAWVEKKKLVKTVKIIQLYCPAREHSLEVSMNKSKSHLSICHSSLILWVHNYKKGRELYPLQKYSTLAFFLRTGKKIHRISSEELTTSISNYNQSYNYMCLYVCSQSVTSDALKWITRYNWKRAAFWTISIMVYILK